MLDSWDFCHSKPPSSCLMTDQIYSSEAQEFCYLGEHLGVQERNSKYAGGGQEASRITANARRKLSSLGTALKALKEILEYQDFQDM